MHYYLYEIKNNINGKIYVGVHKTKIMPDSYMGSGKVIKHAIEKYGLQNFTKTILETFDTPEQMFLREKQIVTDDFLLREDVYNLRRGGSGGFDFINNSGMPKMLGKNHSRQTKDRLSELMAERHKNGTAPKMTGEVCKNISQAKLGTKYKSRPPKSEEHKRKISDAIKKKWQEKKLRG